MRRRSQLAWALAAMLLLRPAAARAWGERGHHAAARAAALSILMGVELDDMTPARAALYRGLEDFFRRKALELGHLSNIPDTAWRSAGPLPQALNAPTHFIDVEALTEDFDAIPLDYPSALQKFQGKPNRLDGKPLELFEQGTIIWRAQELYALLVARFKQIKSARGPDQAKAAAVTAVTSAGILAHFIGDASMPYHSSADPDGYGTGNGGIHSYFETDSPNTDSPKLEWDVFSAIGPQYGAFGVEEKFNGAPEPAAFLCRELAKQAHGRIADIRRLDDALVLERSTAPGAGHFFGLAARRPGPEKGLAAFRPVIVEQVALSAAVLARLWRGAWEEAGRPDLSQLKYWDYAHKPDFIAPEYDPEAVRRIKNKLKK